MCIYKWHTRDFEQNMYPKKVKYPSSFKRTSNIKHSTSQSTKLTLIAFFWCFITHHLPTGTFPPNPSSIRIVAVLIVPCLATGYELTTRQRPWSWQLCPAIRLRLGPKYSSDMAMPSAMRKEGPTNSRKPPRWEPHDPHSKNEMEGNMMAIMAPGIQHE